MTPDLEPPFDPRADAAEIESVLRRVHRRRAVRAGGSGVALSCVVVAAALVLGGSGPQTLVQDDDPVGPASSGPSTAPAGPLPSPTAPAGSPGPVVATPTALPSPLLGGPRSPTPRPSGQATAAPQPKPAAQRPVYAGQLGPTYVRFEATDCVVVNRSTNDGVIRNDYCAYFIGGGRSDAWQPSIRICRVYDSTTPGRLTFTGGEEADFALYRGSPGPEGQPPVPGQLLFRFSDTVRYVEGAHGRDVEPGDCWTWRLDLPIDFDSYPADTGFVGEWRTTAQQVPADERRTRTYFTAGDFHSQR